MKIFLTSFIIILSLNAYSQSEALSKINIEKTKNNMMQAKELSESILQYETMLKNSTLLTEMRDLYNKVSDAVNEYTPVKNSINNMHNTIELYKDISENLKESPTSKKTINVLDKRMLSIIKSNYNNIKDLKKIMSSEDTKMNDGERMELAAKIEERTYKNYKTMKIIKETISTKCYIY